MQIKRIIRESKLGNLVVRYRIPKDLTSLGRRSEKIEVGAIDMLAVY